MSGINLPNDESANNEEGQLSRSGFPVFTADQLPLNSVQYGGVGIQDDTDRAEKSKDAFCKFVHSHLNRRLVSIASKIFLNI